MPGVSTEKQVFSLSQVATSIQRTLEQRYTSAFWVKAEINKLNFYPHSGHCYPELVEKKDGKIVAQMRSNLWKDDYLRINDIFQSVLKEPLKDGIKVLFLAKVSFTPAYGLALTIHDIDPSYTLGDLEREKQETIDKLKTENIFALNKSLSFPLLPQRIAIISVESSKGYADFMQVIGSNEWHYRFSHALFPALLQGDKAVDSILSQLYKISTYKNYFDVVAIIRGGGGDVGLSCYNNERLARAIALFPIPVITGIGHATNETVSEMVAHTNAITPTKLAEFLIQRFHQFATPVQDAQRKIADLSQRMLSDEKNKFQVEIKLFKSVTENILASHHYNIRDLSRSLIQSSHFIFQHRKEHLRSCVSDIARATNNVFATRRQQLRTFDVSIRKDCHTMLDKLHLTIANMEKNISNMSPENVLRRGYSITYLNGQLVKNISGIKAGDKINTQVLEGNIESTVTSTNNEKL